MSLDVLEGASAHITTPLLALCTALNFKGTRLPAWWKQEQITKLNPNVDRGGALGGHTGGAPAAMKCF